MEAGYPETIPCDNYMYDMQMVYLFNGDMYLAGDGLRLGTGGHVQDIVGTLWSKSTSTWSALETIATSPFINIAPTYERIESWSIVSKGNNVEIGYAYNKYWTVAGENQIKLYADERIFNVGWSGPEVLIDILGAKASFIPLEVSMSIDRNSGRLYLFYINTFSNGICYLTNTNGNWSETEIVITPFPLLEALGLSGTTYSLSSSSESFGGFIDLSFAGEETGDFYVIADYLLVIPLHDSPVGAPAWYPTTTDANYLFFEQGRDTLIKDLWTGALQYTAFVDSPGTDFFWWSDDQCKALAVLAQDPEGDITGWGVYDTYIDETYTFLDTYLEYDGMVIRRVVDPLITIVERSNPQDFKLNHGFIVGLEGNLKGASWADNVIELFYRQSEAPMGWIKGQYITYEVWDGGVHTSDSNWMFEKHITSATIDTSHLPSYITLTQIATFEYATVTIVYTMTQDVGYVKIQTSVKQDSTNPNDIDLKNVKFANALDQLSLMGAVKLDTKGAGTGMLPVGYTDIFYPGYGEVTANAVDGQHLFNATVSGAWDDEYFILHIKDIPDIFDQSLAIVVQLDTPAYLNAVDNFVNPDNPTWENLHHVLFYNDLGTIGDTATTVTYGMKYTLLDGHDWTQMTNYDRFFNTYTMIDTTYPNLDFSLDHQYGIVLFGLGETLYTDSTNATKVAWVENIWNYWNDMYHAVGERSYMQGFPYGIIATYRLYQVTGNATYRTEAIAHTADLLAQQELNPALANYGGFKEWGGAEYTYLDFTNPAAWALKFMYGVEGDPAYKIAYELAFTTLNIDVINDTIWCYKDGAGLYPDTDVNTYKSAMALVTAIDLGPTADLSYPMQWRAFSHIMNRTTDNLINPRINVGPTSVTWGQEINVETQSWSLLAWLAFAQYQYTYFGSYVRSVDKGVTIEGYDYSAYPNMAYSVDLTKTTTGKINFWSGGYKVSSVSGSTTYVVQALPYTFNDAILTGYYDDGTDKWVFAEEEGHVLTCSYNADINIGATIAGETATFNMAEGMYTTATPIGWFKVRFPDFSNDISIGYYTAITLPYFTNTVVEDHTELCQVNPSSSPIYTLEYNIKPTITVAFGFALTRDVQDILDTEVYMASSGRQLYALAKSNYFNIYNIGGFSEITHNANAGEVVGGDVFEIYADRGGSIIANATYRKLQGEHILFNIECADLTSWDLNETDDISFYMGIDYNYNAEWLPGWYVKIEQTEGWINANTQRLNWKVDWYYQDALVKTTYMNSFPFTNDISAGEPTSTSFILDLWFNKINASSTVGGRITSEYYAMSDSSNGWFRWATGSTWGRDISNSSQVMLFESFKDSIGNVISVKQVELTRPWFKIVSSAQNSADVRFTLRDFDVFDLTTTRGVMEGINTPSFVATKDPQMAQGGFLNSLWSSLQQTMMGLLTPFGNVLTNARSIITNSLIDAVDTILGLLGMPGAFRAFTVYVSQTWTVVTTQLAMAVNMLITIVTFVASIFGYVSFVFISFFGTVTSLVTIIIGIFNGTYSIGGAAIGALTGLGDMWNTLNLAVAFPLITIYLIVDWLGGLKGTFGQMFKQARDDVQTFLGVTLGVAQFIIEVLYTLVINVVSFIRSMIPVI